jgi:hypothetical protein
VRLVLSPSLALNIELRTSTLQVIHEKIERSSDRNGSTFVFFFFFHAMVDTSCMAEYMYYCLPHDINEQQVPPIRVKFAEDVYMAFYMA